LKIGSAGLGSDCSLKMSPDGRNRLPRLKTKGKNKREDRCPPFCNFAAFATYRDRRRVRVFARLLGRRALARSRPFASRIRDATV